MRASARILAQAGRRRPPVAASAAARRLVGRQVAIEQVDLSPDGEAVVYSRRVVRGNAYRSHLWRVSWSGGRPERLTDGAVRDQHPHVSPDGAVVAFIRTRVGPRDMLGEVWTVPSRGGRARRLARLPHGAEGVQWSPDGRLLAVVGRGDGLPFEVAPGRRGDPPRARRIDRLDFRDDEVGYISRRNHLWLLPVGGGPPRQLTSGEFSVGGVRWMPDGAALIFAADRRADRDVDPRPSIWRIGVEGDALRELVALSGEAEHAHPSPDGTALAFVGIDVPDPPDHEQPLVWVAATGPRPRPLTGSLDLPAGSWGWTDLLSTFVADQPGPFWLDERTLVAVLTRRGRAVPWRLGLDSGLRLRAARPLVADDRPFVTSVLAARAGRVAVVAAAGGDAPEVYAIEPHGPRRLTRNGSAWLSGARRPEVRELEIPGPGGPIHGWLTSPPGAGEAPLPTIIHFHGGPTGSFGSGIAMDELVLVDAGYRILRPNIRGSASFGADWIAALGGAWGRVDAADALAATDFLVSSGLADERRIGILGLSYGGFLVQWLVGATDRYRAAVAENGVGSQLSAWSGSYFGVYYNRRAGLAEPLTRDGVLDLWEHSPISQAHRIRTPLLLLQSEEDRVCPPADNEALFTALRVLERPVEYVLYPEEHHEMKITGRPDRRIDRHERILDWFGRHLGPS